MLRSDIPKVLFSSIKEDDPYRTSKLFQIERWCYANWDLHKRGGKKRHNFLAQVLSSEDCWKKVDNLHGVKLDRYMVGKKLIMPGSPFSNPSYDIACRCCLEEDIIALFEERKKRLSAQGKSSLLEYGHLVRCCGSDLLVQFWSHFVSGHISKLNLNGRHPYEYGLNCAMSLKQAEAVEFFWNKIKSLPESEMSEQKKDEIFMKTAVYAAGSRCNSYPEIFEFCFSQINPGKYPELLKRDLAENGYYGSLNTLQGALRFDQFQKLFDFLSPNSVSEDDYNIWLDMEIKKHSEPYVNEIVKLFMHMWMKEGFDSHRALVIREELEDKSPLFRTVLLTPLVEKDYMEPVWAILDIANCDQIKKFMDSRQAEYIRSVLEKRDVDSLNKFLAYGKSVTEELDRGDLSTGLTKVKLSKACEQLGLGN
ncbi:hypothetical protein Wcon_01485 [Wolbachia endosymbiont of Cylisticus convexus]|uniref:hypothetical protein n=1 Tax=Wolbachia endosymbiont of Cylisticus convexus TaxID=118728 RepID=UPI000DF6E21E|nr:hypothetical protein [Wolbachia endosymbiont of Cylisticus convexus]RDD34438.1 hypothetical protein Wcon_01485 [Wolbachia endosymbiont of Cylisticus convexus]